jgi:HAD superfamily hydrolase (TIGR01490 family)
LREEDRTGGSHVVGEEEAREPLSPTDSGELTGAAETPGVLASATAADSAVRAGEAAAAAAVAAGDGPPDVPLTDLTAAAFFDVDNTMMIGASIFHFARGLAARKFFTTADLMGFAWQQLKFRVGGRETRYSTTTGRDTALSFVAGRSVAEITALGEEIYDELMVDRIWAGTRALAQMHLDAGQRVWLVTATPVELALIIARRLGLTGALGTVAESVDGHYTGRLVGEILHGPAKAHAVRALAATEGLDLRRCTAYSDSINDVPMLSAVGSAVAVNPDSELREVAKERGWQIRDFRTGRKAARIGVPSVLGAGAVAGAVAAGRAYWRR